MIQSLAHRTGGRTVDLVATGGTIASRHTDAGVVASVSGAELLAAIDPRVLAQTVKLNAIDLGLRGSYALTVDDMKAIADTVIQRCEAGAQGVVVTHGTDSLEETAFLIDLLHAREQPVVLTGAQRPFDDPESDGPTNLALAIATAADVTNQGNGVQVAFAGNVFPAIGVRKVSTEDLAAFANPLRNNAAPRGSRGFLQGAAQALADQTLAPVTVVAAVPGGDGTGVRDAAGHRPAGIIFQALGIGNSSIGDAKAVAEATAEGIPVLVTSRVGHGEVRAVYGNGGGKALEQAGAVFAGELSTWQARILLSVCLTLSASNGLNIAESWIREHAVRAADTPEEHTTIQPLRKART